MFSLPKEAYKSKIFLMDRKLLGFLKKIVYKFIILLYSLHENVENNVYSGNHISVNHFTVDSENCQWLSYIPRIRTNSTQTMSKFWRRNVKFALV